MLAAYGLLVISLNTAKISILILLQITPCSQNSRYICFAITINIDGRMDKGIGENELEELDWGKTSNLCLAWKADDKR